MAISVIKPIIWGSLASIISLCIEHNETHE